MKNIFGIVLVFMLGSCSAQNGLSKQDSIKANNGLMKQLIQVDNSLKEVDSFLRKQDGVISYNVLNEPDNYGVFILNLISNIKYDFSTNHGLFVIGQPSADADYYLYFKNIDQTVNIMDYDDDNEVESLTKELQEHFKRNNIKDKETKLKYLFGVVKFLNSKYTYPVSINCLPNSWECDDNTTKKH